jgi:hypothetical protein
MVTRRHSYTALQQGTQRLPKLRLKSHIAITHNLLRHTMSADPVFEEQLSHISSRHSSHTRNKSNQSTKTIYNRKNTIIATNRYRQISNKIHSHMSKWSTRIFYRNQQTRCTLSTTFVSTTNWTTSNKLLNRTKHILPIETFLCQLQKLLTTKMSS